MAQHHTKWEEILNITRVCKIRSAIKPLMAANTEVFSPHRVTSIKWRLRTFNQTGDCWVIGLMAELLCCSNWFKWLSGLLVLLTVHICKYNYVPYLIILLELELGVVILSLSSSKALRLLLLDEASPNTMERIVIITTHTNELVNAVWCNFLVGLYGIHGRSWKGPLARTHQGSHNTINFCNRIQLILLGWITPGLTSLAKLKLGCDTVTNN